MGRIVYIANRTILPPRKTNTLVKLDYDTDDIIEVIKRAHKQGLPDTKKFAEEIPGTTVREYLSNLWHFLKSEVQYKVDPIGDQWVKTPARFWHDRIGDCKSFSIFIGTVLQNKGIPFKYRFVSFIPGSRRVTHVYIIVPCGGSCYITMDVVYTAFNAEKKPFYYKKDIDMAGLHFMAGIGQSKEKLFDLGNRDLSQVTDGEMDLLIARDRLQTEKEIVERVSGIGSFKSEKYQDSIDMIDDAISAVRDYQIGALDDIDTELALISAQATRGEYSQAAEIYGIGSFATRLSKRVLKRKKLKTKRNFIKSRLTRAQVANIWGIAELSGIGKTKGFLKRVAKKVKKAVKTTAAVAKKAGKAIAKNKVATVLTGGANKMLSKDGRKQVKKAAVKVVKTAVKVATAPARLIAKGVLEVSLPKSAPFFLYLFINDKKLLERAPDSVRKKRAKSEKVANIIVNGIGMKRDHFMGIVRNGIMKHYGKSPENVIAEMTKGISGIGVYAAAITALIGIIKKILSLVKKKDPSVENISAADAPDSADWKTLAAAAKQQFIQSVKKQVENPKSTATANASSIIKTTTMKENSSPDQETTGGGEFSSGGRSIWNSLSN